jgi:hypothetical protein
MPAFCAWPGQCLSKTRENTWMMSNRASLTTLLRRGLRRRVTLLASRFRSPASTRRGALLYLALCLRKQNIVVPFQHFADSRVLLSTAGSQGNVNVVSQPLLRGIAVGGKELSPFIDKSNTMCQLAQDQYQSCLHCWYLTCLFMQNHLEQIQANVPFEGHTRVQH